MPLTSTLDGNTGVPETPPDSVQMPTFARCPRTELTTGHQDWLCLKDPRFPDFDICPTCFDTTIASTEYRHYFQKSQPKSFGMGYRCDFGKFWVRLAFTKISLLRVHDLSLLPSMASVTESAEGQCPGEASELGGEPATRMWYTILDPQNNQPLTTMTLCSDCCTHLTAMDPELTGAFTAVSSSPCSASCDIRGSTNRSFKYLALLWDIATKTRETGHRDLTPLATFIHRFGSLPICQRDNVAFGPY